MEVEERVPYEGGWEISLWNSWEKHRYLSKGIGNGSMNLISHVQSMLRLQLKIHIVRSSCFMDYRDRDVRITGSHLCEWYMDKQSLVPKAFVFQSYFLLHTRNVLYPLLKK